MLRSLMSGVSGVKAHQTKLDVTGNNIANVSTAGFKKSAVTFQDLLYQTSSGASAPSSGHGGVNPVQVGLGTRVAAIETVHSQGPLSYTGNRTDMAIDGDGYFVVQNGPQTLYTRAGNFITDGSGNLVQSGTGFNALGYALEPDPNDPTKMVPSTTLADINIPVGQKMPARATTTVGYRCNLDSRAGAYLPMGTLTEDVRVTGELGDEKREFSFSEGNTVADFLKVTISGVATPLSLEMTGVDSDTGRPQLEVTGGGTVVIPDATGTDQTYNIAFDSATGKLSFVNAVDASDSWDFDLGGMMDYQTVPVKDDATGDVSYYLAEFDDSVDGSRNLRVWGPDDSASAKMTLFEGAVSVNADGTFAIDSAAPVMLGDAAAENTRFVNGGQLEVTMTGDGRSLVIGDSVSGETVQTVQQRLAGTHTTKVDIFDSLGNAHTLETSWEKIDNNRWRWRVWTPSEELTINPASGVLEFGPDGKISTTDPADVEISFGALGAENQSVSLDFSGKSFGKEEIEGVTQYGSEYTTKAYYRNGYDMGVLNDFAVSKDGTVQGVYSNGMSHPLYKVALALFSNPQGLEKVGSTAFIESPNSGIAQIVTPQTGGAGKIAGGTLEMSNVDLSEEFVNLITAQRGFQANARVITTSDQVLEELLNLKR